MLVGTDQSAPYSYDFKNMEPGRYYIQAKAYDAAGKYKSVDVRTLMVTENNITATTDEQDNALLESKLKVYPNPTKNELFISGSLVQNSKYEITSIEGKALQAGVLNGGSIDVENLKAGIYFIKIKTESGDKVQRFVKE